MDLLKIAQGIYNTGVNDIQHPQQSLQAFQQALQKYIGGNKPASPIPQENVLNTAQKRNLSQTTDNQLDQLHAYNPAIKINRDAMMNQAMQYGGFTPAQINNIAYQAGMDQNAKVPLVTPAPQATPTPTQTPIAQIGGNIVKGVENAMSSFRALGQAQANQDPDQLAMPIFKQYGISPQVAFGVKQAEGGKRNPWDIGAKDSNPNSAPLVTDPVQQATLAAKAMRKLLDDAHVTSTDPDVQLNALEQHFAGDPKTWKQRSIDEARKAGGHGAGEYFNSWADFVKATPNWKKYAN